jgi:hypothetical protein
MDCALQTHSTQGRDAHSKRWNAYNIAFHYYMLVKQLATYYKGDQGPPFLDVSHP